MTVPLVTALYAGILGLLIVALATDVALMRMRLKIPFGDGGNAGLVRRVRAHGNLVETATLTLLLLALAEMLQHDPRLIHGLGIALVIGRLCHAPALLIPGGNQALRAAGVLLTFGVQAILSVLLILCATGVTA